MNIANEVTAWLPVLLVLAAFFYFRGHGGGTALEELERANGVLEKRLDEVELEKRQLAQVVGALEQRTNLEPIAAAVVDQFATHEARAQERHDKQMTIMGLIATYMGKLNEANGA